MLYAKHTIYFTIYRLETAFIKASMRSALSRWHAFGNMSVNVQCKSSRMMTAVLLDGFHIAPRL